MTPISDLLRAAFLQDQPRDQEQKHPLPPDPISIPYYSFVTKVDLLNYSEPGKHIIFNKTLVTRTTFKDHLEHRGQTGRYLLEEVPVNIPIERRQYFNLTARAATRELRRDLTWALCLANVEHIKELVIPIMDITRYVALVPRLKVLSKVTFLLDKGFQVTTRYGPTYTPAEQEQLELQKSKRILAFEEMVSFVQEHRRVSPHVLKRGRSCRDPYASNDDCPEEHQFRLLQALPPLISPSVLDQQNWPQFVAKAHETDLSLRRRSQVVLSFTGAVFSRVIVPFLDDDTFQWAVDERKQHDAEIVAGRTPLRPLVPLRIFATKYDRPAFGRQLNDVAFAFGGTLEDITEAIDAISRCPRLSHIFLKDRRQEYQLDEVVYWTPTKPPLLKELALEGTPAISFHPDILHGTTNLTDLKLEIFTLRVDVAFIPPAEELDGADDESIDDNNKNANSPPTHESVPRKRPTWTWDWHLPNLVSLTLNTEFGYRFKFRMLAGTPNLVRFNVGIGSQFGQHRRTVGIADLLQPGYQHPAMDRSQNQEQQRQRRILGRHVVGDIDNSGSPIELEENDDKFWKDFEYVHVPALKYLTLTGPWSLDGRVLEVLFGKVAPGVENLIMSSEGHSVCERVKATSEHLHALESAHLCVDGVTDESLSKVGMKPDSSRTTQGNYLLVEPPVGRTVASPAHIEKVAPNMSFSSMIAERRSVRIENRILHPCSRSVIGRTLARLPVHGMVLEMTPSIHSRGIFGGHTMPRHIQLAGISAPKECLWEYPYSALDRASFEVQSDILVLVSPESAHLVPQNAFVIRANSAFQGIIPASVRPPFRLPASHIKSNLLML
ncbi:hypothetical protein F5H01DRAFT_403405 [Linnemannia elongata]|nr:hypothetical protein F5H01DRAFT_403405 [Linnemannia elongata]